MREGDDGGESMYMCICVCMCILAHACIRSVCEGEWGEINKSAYTFPIGLLLHNLNM